VNEDQIDSTSEIADEARKKLDAIEDDFDSRFADLEARAKASKTTQQRRESRVAAEQKSDRESARGLGIGLSIAYTILGVPLGFFGIGYLIDKASGTTIWQNALGLTGCALGVGTAIWMAQKANK
jgi:F0F1-type ATP synthase assembly protein I